MVNFQVPDDLVPDFLIFLDLAQARFSQDDISEFRDDEKRVFDLVRSWVQQPSHSDLAAFRKQLFEPLVLPE